MIRRRRRPGERDLLAVKAEELQQLERLFDVMAQLRAPGGCPWDRAQTPRTLAPFLLEETYEVLQALDEESPPDIAEELGDLLVQVAMHCAIAAETGWFGIGSVAGQATEKMIGRHPHVFGDVSASSPAEVIGNWEELKRKEKPHRRSALDGVPRALPALALALAIQRRAARLGHDEYSDPQSAGETARASLLGLEGGDSDSLGRLLYAVVALARQLDLDPETELRVLVNRQRSAYEKAIAPEVAASMPAVDASPSEPDGAGIESPRVTLRPPLADDASEFIAAMAERPGFHLPWSTPPIDRPAFAAYLEHIGRLNNLGLLVCRSSDGVIVGRVALNEIVRGALQGAYVSYDVAPRFSGQGYMTAGLRLLIQHAFSGLGLHRLEANIQPDNLRSQALVGRLGFRFEGISPRYLRIQGQWRDHQRWALTNDESVPHTVV